jgi:hypothetical protein
VIKFILELYAVVCAFATIAYAVLGWASGGKADADELEIREFDEFWYRRSGGVTDDAVLPPDDEDRWKGGDLPAPL